MLFWIIVFFIVIGALNNKNTNSEATRKAEEERLNNAAPVQVLPVRVAGRRLIQKDPNKASAVFYLRFEAPDGSSREMQVDQLTYYNYQDGTIGELTYQRTRFLSFNPQAMAYDTQYPQGYPAQQMNGYPQQYPQDYDDQTPLY